MKNFEGAPPREKKKQGKNSPFYPRPPKQPAAGGGEEEETGGWGFGLSPASPSWSRSSCFRGKSSSAVRTSWFRDKTEHGGTLLDILTQWDGVWYRLIAKHGYGPPMPELAAAFFPVYPLLVRAVAFIVRDFQVASLLVSNGCLIAAALLLVRLLRLDYDELVCRRAITFLMFNPVSFFSRLLIANRLSCFCRSAPCSPRARANGLGPHCAADVYRQPARRA